MVTWWLYQLYHVLMIFRSRLARTPGSGFGNSNEGYGNFTVIAARKTIETT